MALIWIWRDITWETYALGMENLLEVNQIVLNSLSSFVTYPAYLSGFVIKLLDS
jgi:hypothetical protein